jgi:hypothetical protein
MTNDELSSNAKMIKSDSMFAHPIRIWNSFDIRHSSFVISDGPHDFCPLSHGAVGFFCSSE